MTTRRASEADNTTDSQLALRARAHLLHTEQSNTLVLDRPRTVKSPLATWASTPQVTSHSSTVALPTQSPECTPLPFARPMLSLWAGLSRFQAVCLLQGNLA